MSDERLRNVINNMLGAGGPGGMPGMGGPPQQDPMIEPLAMAVQQLEMGVIQMAQGQQAMGTALDVARLTIAMMAEVLIEKEVLTKEEWDENYKVKVVEKMQQLQKQIQERIQQQMAEQQMADDDDDLTDEPPIIQTGESNDRSATSAVVEDLQSDVILPSEREDRIMRFPSRSDDED